MYGMKTIKFFCCLFLLVQSPVLLAQQYEVKTIFQLLGGRIKRGLLHRSGTIIIPVAHQYLAAKYGMIWYGMSEYATSSIPIHELAKK